MSLKIINRNIKSIAATGAKLNQLLHGTAVLILEHASEHGDCTVARDLVNAMPASMRRTAMVAWFSKYSPIRFAFKAGTAEKVGMLKSDAKLYVAFNIDAAREDPFFAMAKATPEEGTTELKTFEDVVAMRAAFEKRVTKMIEDGKIAAADVESVQSFVSNVVSIEAARVKAKAPRNPRIRAVEAVAANG